MTGIAAKSTQSFLHSGALFTFGFFKRRKIGDTFLCCFILFFKFLFSVMENMTLGIRSLSFHI